MGEPHSPWAGVEARVSRVTLRLINDDGWVVPYPRQREAGNAWGFAPAVWNVVAESLGLDRAWMRNFASASALPELRRICDVFNTGKIDDRLNLLLGATFDRVWVRREGFKPLAVALRWFYVEHLMAQGIVDTAVQMAVHLEQLRHQPGLLGVGIDATSVNSTWWNQRIPLGTDRKPLVGNGLAYDHDFQPMNIFQHPNASDGKPHWELMAELQSTT